MYISWYFSLGFFASAIPDWLLSRKENKNFVNVHSCML